MSPTCLPLPSSPPSPACLPLHHLIVGRRNPEPFTRGELVLKLKPLLAKQAKEQQGTRTDIPQNSAKCLTPIDTRASLAATAGISHGTLSKVEHIRDAATIWIIDNQRGRRNLIPMVRGELMLKLKPLLVEQAKERQVEGGKSKVPQKSSEPPSERETASAGFAMSYNTAWKPTKRSKRHGEP